jgi:small subunit ribosomal protein S22
MLISFSQDRLIIVRDLDGTLRYANDQERIKMNNIYFPMEGREFRVPKMFSDPTVLDSVLSRASPEDNTYEFVLDRACLQFEPDDPQYIAVVEKTYELVDQRMQYDLLKSTRHYGPMAFYLTRTRKMENLLLYNIQHER